jgi:hypothetical protein
MAKTEQKIVQYLSEARAMEKALITVRITKVKWNEYRGGTNG